MSLVRKGGDDVQRPIVREDTVWSVLRTEAGSVLAREPALATLMLTAVLGREDFESATAFRVASRIAGRDLREPVLADAFMGALAADPGIGAAMRADILAVIERDPAADRLIEPFLYFKGFHAIQAHRFAHWFWTQGRTDLALYAQSQSSRMFQTDIHPAARIGRGIFLDHATGLVVGATSVIEDDVSILQNVTLGGTGKDTGDRHPKIRRGVLIGAGAKILGNIEVGAGSLVAAGSVVLREVPPDTTVAGVPAKPVGPAGTSGEPSRDMNQILSDFAYGAFDYVI
ncbi:serine O-acetyltransferase [uncultured Alsobacter sp.]|uniref:serine O-acetyltransferase n=1 Tax=uncultured Alsobacter sp. TaxID=1748258 RepID=UPI0025ED36D4|nr:serine O-acetyltransferase [uncultured Alsobacter sp.]